MTVCLSGQDVVWPADKLAAERECLIAWWERIRRVAGPIHPRPGDPVEQWLARVRDEDAIALKGLVQALEQLDPERDPKIVQGARVALQGLFDRIRMQGRIAGLGGSRARERS
jgi:hypothetical protein